MCWHVRCYKIPIETRSSRTDRNYHKIWRVCDILSLTLSAMIVHQEDAMQRIVWEMLWIMCLWGHVVFAASQSHDFQRAQLQSATISVDTVTLNNVVLAEKKRLFATGSGNLWFSGRAALRRPSSPADPPADPRLIPG